ncbi:hypothetical protein C0995_009398 [Termitomyces sp. Mi166|nr:hypothetical protein C0995_009398 [Termitomyces sp. Mi166\
MPESFAITIMVTILVASSALSVMYTQTDSHQGSGFLKSFSFQAIPDPTHGRVNYVDAATAARKNLTFSSGNHFVLRADDKQVLSPSGPGRDSVRLQSNKQYTTSVTVFNIRHMPRGCGTWPAIWTVGSDWPNQGEIDIVEGVNDMGPNTATLHTNAGESTLQPTLATSRRSYENLPRRSTGNNCDVAATNNVGCGVKFSDSRSYGPTFNSNRGGWFAMERTTSFIKVWFWPRTAGNVPPDVKNGARSVNTDNWAVIGPVALLSTPRLDVPPLALVGALTMATYE